MTKILFVCLGNICRSPMAEYIFKKMAADAGTEDAFYVESAATSDEEHGNPIYLPAARTLAKHGIPYEKRHARQIRRGDYDDFDLIIGMDRSNIRNMLRIFGSDKNDKIKLMMSYCGKDADVADPWYTGEFETAYNDISNGCKALFNVLQAK